MCVLKLKLLLISRCARPPSPRSPLACTPSAKQAAADGRPCPLRELPVLASCAASLSGPFPWRAWTPRPSRRRASPCVRALSAARVCYSCSTLRAPRPGAPAPLCCAADPSPLAPAMHAQTTHHCTRERCAAPLLGCCTCAKGQAKAECSLQSANTLGLQLVPTCAKNKQGKTKFQHTNNSTRKHKKRGTKLN